MWLTQLVYITYIVDLGCAVQDVITSDIFIVALCTLQSHLIGTPTSAHT